MIYLLGGKKKRKNKNKNSSEPTFPFQDAIIVSFHFVTEAVSYLMKSYKIESEHFRALTIQRNINGSHLLYTAAYMT